MSAATRHRNKRYNRVRLGPYRAHNTCPTTGKKQFADRVAAEAELLNCKRLRAKQGNNHHVETRAYLCAQCLQYHLTSQPRSEL